MATVCRKREREREEIDRWDRFRGEREREREREVSYYVKEESGKQGMLGLIEIDLYRWMEFESRK